MTLSWLTRSGIRLIGKVILIALLVCGLTDVACSQGKVSSESYDVTQRRLDTIPPGTVIGKEAPKGWSNLIIKSHPKPGTGDTDQLSPIAMRLSSLLFTAVLADVQPDRDAPGRHRLARVAAGIGTQVGGKDMILTPQTARRQGANLGLLGGIVLSRGQEKLQEMTVQARSKTMAVFDSPSLMARDGRHVPVLLRYAVLIDPRTGRLDTLLWLIDREGEAAARGPTSPLVWLAPGTIEECILHVDAREFSMGTPTEKAFAPSALPKGKKDIPCPDELKTLAVRLRFSPAMAADLEAKLRKVLEESADK
jgi:hypothetical protein